MKRVGGVTHEPMNKPTSTYPMPWQIHYFTEIVMLFVHVYVIHIDRAAWQEDFIRHSSEVFDLCLK